MFVWGSKLKAFTLVEILSTLAIIAVLVAMMVPAIGDYVRQAQQTADRKTLMVLNDALNRYKTQGGDLTALTSAASIGNILDLLQTPVTWAGVSHQFLKSGTTYTAASLGALGEGARFRFTKYGNFADGSVVGSDILETYSAEGYDVGNEAEFDNWITQAMADTGSTNYLALTNPSDAFEASIRSANNGEPLYVWWGDGTSSKFTLSSGSDTVVANNYGSIANRPIILVGNISRIVSQYDDGRSDWGGNITTMKSLAIFYGSQSNINLNMSVSGNISQLPNISHIKVWGSNTMSGDITNMTTLVSLDITGNNTISGSVDNLVNLTVLKCYGSNTISGNIENLDAVTFFSFGGNNTLTGDISKMDSLNYVNVTGNNTLSGDITAMTSLTNLSVGGNNTISGDLSNLTNLFMISLAGSHTTTGWSNLATNAPELSYLRNNGTVALNEAEVDAILAGMVTNKDHSKPNSNRWIDLDNPIHAAPSSAGQTSKAILEGDGWTVLTN